MNLGLLVNLLIRLSIFYFLGEVMLSPDDPRFAGKAIPVRNLIIVVTFSLLFPFLYFVRKRWPFGKVQGYPFWLDNLYLSIFWLDMAGNHFDLYDSYFYFDLFPHFHGTGALAAVLMGGFGFSGIVSIVASNVIHGLLEVQESLTDVFVGTHNVRGAFDSINDMIVGVLGTVIYVGATSYILKHKATKVKVLITSLILFLLFAMSYHKDLAAHTKTLLFIPESFPQIGFKPLSNFTDKPIHSKLELDLRDGIINADLFTPSERFTPPSKKRKPAVIIAMGVKTADKDRPLILDFGNNLSRLGYVAFWPRLKVLDEGVSLPEDPKTFVNAFQYLEKQEFVDKNRISFVGFSVGSSIALVAAEDPSISNKVHSLIFFGGYYDIFDYLESLDKKSMVLNGKRIKWEPSEGATNHVEEILKTLKLGNLETVLKTMPEEFRILSPSKNIDNFKASIFILHEISDNYVPYVESIKLSDNLPKDVGKAFVLVNLFEHVQPKKGLSKEALGEFYKLYSFVAEVFKFL